MPEKHENFARIQQNIHWNTNLLVNNPMPDIKKIFQA